MNRTLLAALLALFLFSGCNWRLNPFHRKKMQEVLSLTPNGSTPKAAERSGKEKTALLKKVTKNQADFQSFSAKAKVNAEMNNSGLNLSANIRIKHDAVIWVSVSAIAGIEVARMLITPDSIKILDRLKGRYIKQSFAYIHNTINKEIDFAALEAILVGKIPPAFLTEKLKLTKDSTNAVLTASDTSILYAFTIDDKERLKASFFSDQVYNQDLRVSYDAFKTIDKASIPMLVSLVSKLAQESMKAELTYSKVELNQELEFPFNVPRKFEEK